MGRQSYLKGALTISIGGFVSKLLGAVYRIPLIAILGGRGMGIYQMVYPLYCILLTVSASGIPTGLARLVSSDGTSGAERTAFWLFGIIGLAGTAVMYLLSDVLAAAQGEPAVALCARILSPSVFFVAIISVVRGYFQGKGDMRPTAFTEVAEQLIKVLAGVITAYLFRQNLTLAVAAAIFAVTLSEAVCALIAWNIYRAGRGKRPLYRTYSSGMGQVFRYTLPLTLTAIAPPLAQLAESIIVVRLLREGVTDATSLYGIYSGCAVTLVSLPVSLAYGLAAASIPAISPMAARGDAAGAKKMATKALWLTLALSVPCALILYVFSPLASRIIFSSLSPTERQLLVKLVRIMAVNVVTWSLVQTSSACLTALGKPLCGTLTQWGSAAIKLALAVALVGYTSLSVSGAAIASNCAYFVALFMNLCYIIAVKQTGRKKNVHNFGGIRGKAGTVDACGKGGA